MRRKLAKQRAIVRAGVRSGKSEPLDMAEIKSAARRKHERLAAPTAGSGAAFIIPIFCEG